jgi:hypothetical protein
MTDDEKNPYTEGTPSYLLKDRAIAARRHAKYSRETADSLLAEAATHSRIVVDSFNYADVLDEAAAFLHSNLNKEIAP